MTPINEIFTEMTTFPGTIAYHLVILTSLLIALTVAIRTHKKSAEKSTRNILIGIIIIFFLQVLLLGISTPAWFDIFPFNKLQPTAYRFLTLVSYTTIIWLQLQDEPQKWKNIAAGIAAGNIALFAGLTILLWNGKGALTVFNGTQLDFAWQLIGLLLSTIGIFLLTRIKRYKKGFESFLIILITLTGHLLHLFFPNQGNLPAFVAVSQLLVYPLLNTTIIMILHQTLPGEMRSRSQALNESRQQKVDIAPRLASTMLEISLQSTQKKINNSVTHAISLFMMADICALLQLDKTNNTVQVLSIYDLIREDYLKVFAVTETQAPDLVHAFQDVRLLQINKHNHSTDFKTLSEAIGYNQLGNPLFIPIKFNGREVTWGFLLFSPYTLHQWQQDEAEKLDALSPNLVRILDSAVEIDARTSAFDSLQVEMNQCNRENQKLQQQFERSQQLLAELRTEFNASKTSHLEEVKLWMEKQKRLEEQIETLEKQLADAQVKVSQAKEINALNKQMENQLAQANAQNSRLQEALSQAKSVLEGIMAVRPKEDEPANLKKSATTPDSDQSKEETTISTLINPVLSLESVKDSLKTNIEQKKVTLQINTEDCPNEISIDQTKFEKILKGLLLNAVQASPNGGTLKLNMSKDQSEEEQNGLAIEVTDEGGGLSLQEQNSFFNLIERVGQPVPGGIGNAKSLREVLRILRQIDGGFWIQSDVDKPTTYRVFMPGQANSQDEGKIKK